MTHARQPRTHRVSRLSRGLYRGLSRGHRPRAKHRAAGKKG
ncbi:hypothetical protein BURMUCGD2M_4578 [Burkholderia multivorans CGD2M]|uniref:Uncharacterized protein n=1 Tax=Burkholderia multivorans CGD2 TaxID=513052 RepID=B9BHN5_9BURK|nr:hypothetical protein BURMUCGD2_4590 [Burkholderia multivorans CGD2]EEE15136.1 hypothetical protein BURMUCGD2M_4578 [Burkholderia multivorans CGD2M]